MTELMTSARLHQIGGKLSIDRIKIPSLQPDDVLVRARAGGICHSDINYRKGIAPVGKLPIILGHEIAGIVAKTGRRTKGLREGDRVLVHYIASCGKCVFCQANQENYCVKYQMIGKDIDGGFSEYVRVPARSIVKLPESIPLEQGAIMGCAVPTAFHALRRARAKPGDTVVVFGIGGLGIHAVQLASRLFKAGTIIAVDLADWKLKQAKRVGAKLVINPTTENVSKTIYRITDGKLADAVLDFVGVNQTIGQAIDCVGKGGRLALVGIGSKSMEISPYKSIIGKEMEIIGVDDHLKTELIQLVELVRSKKLDLSRSITHKVRLEDIDTGFRILEDLSENPIRVVAVM
jgi:2-desacetyl-2-hydroxyethyl bacteriochlorophyllide A dehydrogenase